MSKTKMEKDPKPQNWDKAKALPHTYFCPCGCGQRVPKSEEHIHQGHCPGKKLYPHYRREFRKNREGANITDSKTADIDDGGCGSSEMEDVELWNGLKKDLRNQEQINGNRFFRKLKETEKIDVVDLFLEQLSKYKNDKN